MWTSIKEYGFKLKTLLKQDKARNMSKKVIKHIILVKRKINARKEI